MATFSVVLSDPASLQPTTVSKGFAGFIDIPQFDALMMAKNCWGVLGVDLPEPEAKALASAFAKAGVGTLIVASNEMSPHVGWSFMRLAIENDHLAFTGRLEEKKTLPLATVRVIEASIYSNSATRVTLEKKKPSAGAMAANLGFMMMTGMPFKIVNEKKEEEKRLTTTEMILGLSLVGGNPLQRFDMEVNSFDYSLLKEEKTYNSFANFKLLVQRLAQKCPTAFKSKGAQVFISNGMVNQMGYQEWGNAERELVWLTVLARMAG